MSPSGRVNYFWRRSFFSYTDIWQQSELCTAAAHREEVKSSTEAVKTGHQSTEKHLKWTVCLFVLHLQSECGHLCWYKILEKHLNLLSFLFLDLTKVKYHVYYWNHKRGNIKNHLTDWCAAFFFCCCCLKSPCTNVSKRCVCAFLYGALWCGQMDPGSFTSFVVARQW